MITEKRRGYFAKLTGEGVCSILGHRISDGWQRLERGVRGELADRNKESGAVEAIRGGGEHVGKVLRGTRAYAEGMGMASATRQTHLGLPPWRRMSRGGGMCGEAARLRRRNSGEPE